MDILTTLLLATCCLSTSVYTAASSGTNDGCKVLQLVSRDVSPSVSPIETTKRSLIECGRECAQQTVCSIFTWSEATRRCALYGSGSGSSETIGTNLYKKSQVSAIHDYYYKVPRLSLHAFQISRIFTA